MSDTPTPTVDTARLPVLLSQLRLPTVALLWPALTETADRESWPAAKTLAALMEHEVAERARRRTARHLLEARLPAGKTLDRFDFTAVSSISKARVIALAEGDSWLDQGTNILLFGPPGVGKSHLAAALGHAMVDAGYRVLFTRTTDLVQQLQAARQELRLATAIEKLDKYHLLVLDDLSYVRKSQAETSVIFELISARYERRSLLVTANRPFGSWDSIFPDPAMTVAAIDRRLVHHSIILEMNTDSYRRKSAEMKLRKKSTTASAKDALNEPSPPSEIA
jgi:DNA replication protein DnaC